MSVYPAERQAKAFVFMFVKLWRSECSANYWFWKRLSLRWWGGVSWKVAITWNQSTLADSLLSVFIASRSPKWLRLHLPGMHPIAFKFPLSKNPSGPEHAFAGASMQHDCSSSNQDCINCLVCLGCLGDSERDLCWNPKIQVLIIFAESMCWLPQCLKWSGTGIFTADYYGEIIISISLNIIRTVVYQHSSKFHTPKIVTVISYLIMVSLIWIELNKCS